MSASAFLRLAAAGMLAALAVSTASAADNLAARAHGVLQARCAGCHGGDGKTKGGLDYVLDRDRLVARDKVVPGDAAASALWQRVQNGEMPPAGKPRPTREEADLLRQWIEAGAPPFDAAPRAAFVADGAVRGAILADLRGMDPRARRFSRYLTLTHLANAGASEADMQLHRQALAKLANSLSWHPRLTRLRPVDTGRTVFRLDLRDYRWTARQWDRLAATYPYRPTEADALAREAATLTGCERPFLRGDWFVATAARPPAYHDFLQLPATDRALERQLLVDVLQDLQDERVVRAGFNGSGVARNNRLLERHDGAYGAYWRSYDFSDNTGRQNLFEHPLGPSPLAGAFAHAGGEIIFHLPNGLLGFLLVDGQGRRVDKAPGEIVGDPKRPDKLVETGVSCMSCHVRGFLPKDDQVRAHVLKNATAFSAEDRATALALYPPPARFRALIEEDANRFVKALEALGIPVADPEPVEAVVRRYEGVLDAANAAAEAGVAPMELAERLRRTPELARSLGALLARGGTIQRQVYEAAFGDFARGARPEASMAASLAPAPFAGHHGSIRHVVFSPDGKRLATGGEDGTVRIWDAVSGAERARGDGHSDEVTAVAFAPDARQVLSGSRDRTLRLWDAATGKELRRFIGHTEAVRCVAFTPDGQVALSGGADRTIRKWDVATGRELAVWAGHGGAVAALAVSADGTQVLSGSLDATLRLWDVETGKERGRWTGHAGEVYAVAFSTDGKQALSGGADRTLRLWDVASGKVLRSLAGHANPIIRVAFTADGRNALSAASQYRLQDRAVRSWDLANDREMAPVADAAESAVGCAAFSPDAARVALGLTDGRLRLERLGK